MEKVGVLATGRSNVVAKKERHLVAQAQERIKMKRSVSRLILRKDRGVVVVVEVRRAC
jgi:hypothetical protein